MADLQVVLKCERGMLVETEEQEREMERDFGLRNPSSFETLAPDD